MTEQKEYSGYPKFNLVHSYVVLTVNLEHNDPEVHAHALMRRLDTPNQVKGTLGSYSFDAGGSYEGLGDVSGEPGPECPQELIDGMIKIEKMFMEHWEK